MIAVLPALALIYFFSYLYSLLRRGPDHFPWLAFIWPVAFIVMAGKMRVLDNALVVLIPIFFVPLVAQVAAFLIQKRRGKNLILAYKRTPSNVRSQIVLIVLIFIMSLFISIPNERTYPGGELVFDETFYHERLPLGVFFVLIGLSQIPLIFRKGEIFENGIATPDLLFIPWSGYQSYKWLENAEKKNDERFSLFLKVNKNYSRTIHGFSENTKNVLDEVLKQKFPNHNQPT